MENNLSNTYNSGVTFSGTGNWYTTTGPSIPVVTIAGVMQPAASTQTIHYNIKTADPSTIASIEGVPVQEIDVDVMPEIEFVISQYEKEKSLLEDGEWDPGYIERSLRDIQAYAFTQILRVLSEDGQADS